jgi:phosphate starvation-inducible PhoH-like protein
MNEIFVEDVVVPGTKKRRNGGKKQTPPGTPSVTAGGGARKNKKQINKQIMEGMFDFRSAAAADYDSSSSAVASPPPQPPTSHLSKRERARIEAKFCKPKNERQKKYAQYLNDETKKIIIATGPAGTGKTLMATEHAVKKFIFGEYEKIVFTRPSVAVDEDLGYLPGTAEEKLSVYVRPIYDILYHHFGVKETAQMVEDKIVEICPIGFMRGRTFKNCCIIADEMQNSTQAQMKMLLTRIGENSRLIITGDLEQTDRVGYKENGLEDFLSKFAAKRRASSITSIEFNTNDIEREPVIQEVLDIYGCASIPCSQKSVDDPTLEINAV